MLKFFKTEKIDLYISEDRLQIYSNEKEIVTERREFISLGEDLEKLKKYLKNREINIILEENIFIKKEFLEKEDAEEINIRKYIEQEILKNLSEEKDFYFSCYFFDEDGNCEIFILEDVIITTLVEFLLKNRLKVSEIYISKKKYILKDYKKLFSENNKPSFKKGIFIFIFLLIIIFMINLVLQKRLEEDLIFQKNDYQLKEKNIDLKKAELEKLNRKLIELEKENIIENIFNKKFIEEIFWIINILPEECQIEKVAWENGEIILKGSTQNLDSTFKFASNLEKDKRIKEINFDYILKKDKDYEFILEVELIDGRI